MDVRGWVRESGTCAMSRKRCDRLSRGARAATALLGAAGVALVGAAVDPTPTRADEKVALKIGLLMDFSGGSAEILADRQRAFELAVKHVNEGGGVFALPVAVAVGDATANPETAVAEARRLIEVEGVHAIVGPNSSAASLRIAERVTGPAGVPTVSFSATFPELTGVTDNDFFFRVALSDVLQGPVLARVVREQGIDNVGVVYVDDAWGRGLAGAFEAAWAGTVRSVAVQRNHAGFLSELRKSADAGAKALVVIAPGRMAEALVRESMESGLYDRFAFGDAAKRPGLVRAIGGTRLGGMYGTGPAIAPESPASAAWEAAYVEAHGALPVRAYVTRAYGLTVDRRETVTLERVLQGRTSTAMDPMACWVKPALPRKPTRGAGGGDDALARYDDNRNGRITCKEARRYGIAPVHRSHPAYRYMRDGDGDGVVCE